MSDWSSWGGPPRAVRGGIKAQSRNFANQWWSERWLECLESLCDERRLARGRTYARKGQVTKFELGGKGVQARVQGSRQGAYRVTLEFPTWSPQERERIERVAGSRVGLVGQLLAGNMPEEFESVLRETGTSLFPRPAEVEVDCSCPDWARPCKHVAAVYCLLTEEIDRDPWVLLGLRGVEREEWLARLGLLGAEDAPEPLEEGPFWGTIDVPHFEIGKPPRQDASLPRMLGTFPLWRGETPFLAEMEKLYGELSRRGVELAGEGLE